MSAIGSCVTNHHHEESHCLYSKTTVRSERSIGSLTLNVSRAAKKTTMRYSVQAIESIGSKLASRDLKDTLKPREFVSFYNRTPDEALELWELCSPNIMPKTSPKHMFWCLMYMKLYLPLDVMAVLLNVSVPSLNKWIWLWVERTHLATLP